MAFEYSLGGTLFHRLDPRTKILFFIAIMLLSLWFSEPISNGAVLIAIFAILRHSQVDWNKIRSFLKTVALPATVYALLTLFWGAHSNDYVLFRLSLGWVACLSISLDGIVYAIGATMRFLCIILSIRVVLMLTPIKDLILGFVKLGVPVEFGIALTSGFGYLPILIEEARVIKEAQEVKGWRFKGNPIQRVRALFKLMLPTIMGGIRRAGDIAVALESKGFGYGIRQRTCMKEIKLRNLDYVVCAALVVILSLGFVIGSWGLKIATYKFTLNLLVRVLGIS